jgi:hypothetical protein
MNNELICNMKKREKKKKVNVSKRLYKKKQFGRVYKKKQKQIGENLNKENSYKL